MGRFGDHVDGRFPQLTGSTCISVTRSRAPLASGPRPPSKAVSCWFKGLTAQTLARDMCTVRSTSGQVKSTQVVSSQVMASRGHVRSSRIKSSQVRSVKSGQVGSGQVRSGQAQWFRLLVLLLLLLRLLLLQLLKTSQQVTMLFLCPGKNKL